jgi:hypothetical protein
VSVGHDAGTDSGDGEPGATADDRTRRTTAPDGAAGRYPTGTGTPDAAACAAGDGGQGGAAPGPARGPTGICCSGGGIRSAAFNLGALQALDEAGVLRRADYLSAVSGGSYITSAFAIASARSDPDLLREAPAFARGTPEESWVRNHCSYLADGVVDTLHAVGVALVGFLANLLFLTTLLWVVTRPLGWLYAAWDADLRVRPGCTAGLSAADATAMGCFDRAAFTPPGWALPVIGGLLLAGLAITMAVRMFQPPWVRRAFLRRVAIILLVAGATVAVVTVVLPELIVFTRNVLGGGPDTGPVTATTGAGSSSDKGAANLGLIAGVGGTATIVALALEIARPLRAAAETGVRTVSAVTRRTRSLSRGLRRLANALLGAVLGPLALAAGALVILNGGAQGARPTGGEWLVWGVMALLLGLMALYADVTSWSLHPFYKWRLSRTFAVFRDKDGDGRHGAKGKAVVLPYHQLTELSMFAPDDIPLDAEGRRFPEVLVCAAVNVSDRGVTPPGTGALSWVFSPSRVGCDDPVVIPAPRPWWRRLLVPAEADRKTETESYGPLAVETKVYEERVGARRARDITLSAAVAISGAAIAPTMGKMTNPLLRFLLALTNVRLGVWLPNPRNMPGPRADHPDHPREPVGDHPEDTPQRQGDGSDDTPRPQDDGRHRYRPPANPRQHRLLFEVLGWHRARSKFLYVTDGGHVENLGLYELLRRRCRTIVCLDAAGGSTTRLSTLGEAVALAPRVGACIEIDPHDLIEVEDGCNRRNHVVGRIRYDGENEPSGWLIYGKALVTSECPWDVRAYAAKDERFPVHPTGDQAYGGETFDAYQALGHHVGEACARAFADPEAAARGAEAADPEPLRIAIVGWPAAPPTGTPDPSARERAPATRDVDRTIVLTDVASITDEVTPSRRAGP